MDFKTIRFGSAWLRKTYTCDGAKPIRDACLAAGDHHARERRLQEARYGNNISLLLKACYTFRDFHMSDDLWKALGRIYGVTPEVVKSVVDLFVEARVIFIKQYQPDGGTTWVKSAATHWVDQWILFINGRERQGPPPSVSEVSERVDEFFRKEEQEVHGDLARILSTVPDIGPLKGIPTGPRAMRKRSPSPGPLEPSPAAKKRGIPTGTDVAETQATSFDFGGKEDPLASVSNTNDRQLADYQTDRKHREEPYFRFKFRACDNLAPHQDRHYSEAEDCEALARSNIELQARVESLEKERLESIKAQNDRDDAIRTLQAKFTAFEKATAAMDARMSVNDELIRKMQEESAESQNDRDDAIRALQAKFTALEKASAATDTHISANDELVREMQVKTQKLGAQAEKLQNIEKELGARDQTARSMQTTISSLQEELARLEGAREAQSKELSATLARVTSLEAETVLLNDLHETIRGLKAEVEAQKEKATALSLDSANQQNKQDARLKATEEALEKQDQIVERAMHRILVLEDQALTHNSNIESIEKRVVDGLLGLVGQSLKCNARIESIEKSVVDRLLGLEDQSLRCNTRIESIEKRVVDGLSVLEDQSLKCNTRIESLEKQDQTVQSALDRLLIFEDQSLKRETRIESLEQRDQTFQRVIVDRLLALEDQSLDARIESLENQPDATKDVPRLWARLSAVEQTQDDYLKMHDSQIQPLQVGLEQTRAETIDLSKRLAAGLGCQSMIRHDVSEMQTKIAHIEQHESKISKRLDEMDISRQAFALQNYAARIDELSKSVETLKKLPTRLAQAAEVRLGALRAELNAFYQNQAAVNQQWQARQAASTNGTNGTNSQVVQQLTQKLDKIGWVLQKHMNESREKFNQLGGGDANASDVGRSAKQSSDVAAVVDSLCRRVGIMENGFEVMRDVMGTRRR